jgi:hypothetical protein
MEPYLSHLDRPLDEQSEEIKNFAALKRTLIKAFGNSSPTVNAEAKLRAPKNFGKVSIYATEFRRRLALLLK